MSVCLSISHSLPSLSSTQTAHVTTCAHIARCFYDRAERAFPQERGARSEQESLEAKDLPDSVGGSSFSDGSVKLRWRLENLGEALWYYKKMLAAAADGDFQEGVEEVECDCPALFSPALACGHSLM